MSRKLRQWRTYVPFLPSMRMWLVPRNVHSSLLGKCWNHRFKLSANTWKKRGTTLCLACLNVNGAVCLFLVCISIYIWQYDCRYDYIYIEMQQTHSMCSHPARYGKRLIRNTMGCANVGVGSGDWPPWTLVEGASLIWMNVSISCYIPCSPTSSSLCLKFFRRKQRKSQRRDGMTN